MRIVKIVRSLLQMLNPKEFRISFLSCPICQSIRPIIKLNNDEMSVRCISCRSSAVTMSIASVINQHVADISNIEIYELSSRGPLFKHLKKQCKKLTSSEYFEGVPSGSFKGGILCQDVQKLSFKDKSFDLCTSTDVFEHVPDDMQGFKNIYRVLKPSGQLIFTVPLQGMYETIERASMSVDGVIQHHLPPEYHGDPITESGRILAFRNYGGDIEGKLKLAGFQKIIIKKPETMNLWGFSRYVIVAYK